MVSLAKVPWSDPRRKLGGRFCDCDYMMNTRNNGNLSCEHERNQARIERATKLPSENSALNEIQETKKNQGKNNERNTHSNINGQHDSLHDIIHWDHRFSSKW